MSDLGHPDAFLYKEELVKAALDAQEPVTLVDPIGEHRTAYHAVQEHDGVAWRATIDTVDEREEFDTDPSVKFARAHPENEHRTLCEWSNLATGRLSGPQTLDAWESLFTVFNAALGIYHNPERADMDRRDERGEQ